MKTFIWLVVAIGLLLGSLYFYKDLRENGNDKNSFSNRKQSLEELESNRDRMRDNINKGK